MTSETSEKSEIAAKGVSVIICARNEAENLRHYLHAICCQDYPLFEVIVVNDASEDDTQTVLEHYTQLFRNLRITFVPQQTTAFSRQNAALLPLTLAAKAAQYDYLLFVKPDSRPESRNWLSEMMQGFDNEGVDMVVGRTACFSDRSISLPLRLLQRFSSFDVSAASNLAFRKDAFFRLVRHTETPSFRKYVVRTPDSTIWKLPFRSFRDWQLDRRMRFKIV